MCCIFLCEQPVSSQSPNLFVSADSVEVNFLLRIVQETRQDKSTTASVWWLFWLAALYISWPSMFVAQTVSYLAPLWLK